MTVGGHRVKRYHLNVADCAIEPEIEQAAYAFLPQLLATDDSTPAVAVSVLHRGEQASYLLCYSWVWDNVLELHSAVAGIPLLGSPDSDPRHFVHLQKPWMGCVWELAAIANEPSAWVRHMITPSTPDVEGYLLDSRAPGPVGSEAPF